MKLTIHRGSHEVGGSCVELTAEGSRLFLDLGMPLVNRDGSPFQFTRGDHSPHELVARGVLPEVPGLYSCGTGQIAGLILSHAHLDHYGLADYAHANVPVYASQGTRALLDVSRIFLPHFIGDRAVETLPKEAPVRIGPFTVTAYLVDHSAPDALALLVEAEGKRIFYSGDLRAHGRKGMLFERLLRQPPADIDCLLLEGTTLGRGKQAHPDERAVENAIVEVLKAKTNLGLLFCSSQNIDRLVSVYRAVKRTGSILVIDLYTAYVLRTLQCLSSRLPQFDLPDVRIKYWRHHAECLARAGQRGFLYEAVPARIKVEEIVERRKKTLMLARANSLFEKVTCRLPDLEGLELVWSLWLGYLTGDDLVSRFCTEHRVKLRHIHTSGHATVEDLTRLVAAIKPRHLIPIHTFEPARFREIFDNVLLVNDGDEVRL